LAFSSRCAQALTWESASAFAHLQCQHKPSIFYVISIVLWRNARKIPLKGAAFNPAELSRLDFTSRKQQQTQKMHALLAAVAVWWQKAIFPNTRARFMAAVTIMRVSRTTPTPRKHTNTKRVQCGGGGGKRHITPRVLLLMRRRAGNAIGIPDKDCERPRGHYFILLESKGDKKSFAVEQIKVKYPLEPAYQHPESTHSTQMAARDQ
jgi:hypothetical protein